MKRIVLTSVVEGYADDFLKDLKALTVNPLDRLFVLETELSHLAQSYSDYVKTIRINYDDIIKATPGDMDIHTGRIANLFSAFTGTIDLSNQFTLNVIQDNGSVKSVTMKFYLWIVDALCYDVVQSQIFPKYIKKMGIKSCVYCNAQYAVSVRKGKTSRSNLFRSTYTLDHYLPKSNYPYLATSFFNLYPACSACNQTKSNRPPIFKLYVKPIDPVVERNPFVFNLDKSSFIKYSLTGNVDDLKIHFSANAGIPHQLVVDYEKYFHVEALYGNMNDTIEEVIWKYRVYNRAGRKALYDGFSVVLPNKNDWNRFVLGNFDKAEDIQKRPLAKLVQDVAKQLGII